MSNTQLTHHQIHKAYEATHHYLNEVKPILAEYELDHVGNLGINPQWKRVVNKAEEQHNLLKENYLTITHMYLQEHDRAQKLEQENKKLKEQLETKEKQ